MTTSHRYLPTRAWAPVLAFMLSLTATVPAGAAGNDADPFVVFVGTGASDIHRPQYEKCKNCTYCWAYGGKNLRRNASFFVSPHLMIDYSATARDGLREASIAPASVTDLLITHSHGDHFSPSAIVELVREKAARLTLWGNADVIGAMRKHLDTLTEKHDLVLKELKPCEEFTAGEWQCKALPANHLPREAALVYVLRSPQKSLFYATDTTWLPMGSLAALKSEKLDLAVVEGTFGEQSDPALLMVHNNFDFARLVKRFLFDQKVMKPGGRFALTHLSLHFCEPHDILEPKLRKEDIILPFDGMRLGL